MLVRPDAAIEFALGLITNIPAMIIIVRVSGIVGELTACESRLTLLFPALYLIVAKIATYPYLTELFYRLGPT